MADSSFSSDEIPGRDSLPVYAWHVFSLWLRRRVFFRIMLWAVKERPISVCGKGGGYAVDCRAIDYLFPSGEV